MEFKKIIDFKMSDCLENSEFGRRYTVAFSNLNENKGPDGNAHIQKWRQGVVAV